LNPSAITKIRRVGRAARHRGANATRPSGRAGSTPALSANSRAWHKGCASAFHADKASSSLAARSIPPRSSSGPGCSPFKRDDIGSNPIRGSILHPSLRKGTPFSQEGQTLLSGRAGMRERPNRPAFEAEVARQCAHVRIVLPVPALSLGREGVLSHKED
jgi:hypothetical protein